MPSSKMPRLHSLDALRGSMMLLGLVLHSAVSYMTTPMAPAWPYKDPATSIGFDWLVFIIHLFRMPAFFVVAGLLAAMLYARDGAAGFVRNRARRVLVPLVMFWGVMMPLTGYGFVFSARQVDAPMPWEYLSDLPMWRQPILGHLWFLYYLLIFYVAALALMPLAGRAPAAIGARLEKLFGLMVAKWWGPLAAGFLTAVTLIPMTLPGLDTEASLLPPLRVLIAYGVFFGFGWLLFRQHHLLETLARRWAPALIGGVAIAAGYVIVALQPARFDDPRLWHLTAVAFAGLATWLFIYGLLGLFARHLSAERPMVRYLSDASYWMYLTHLAPAAWLPGVFAHLALPAAIKFLLVFGSTTLVTLVTYHYLVRTTAIGELLNGRRYPRATVTPSAAPRPV